MAKLKDVMEAEEKRRAALTDEEREAEDRDREARMTKALDSFSDTARLAEQTYSRQLADIAAASPTRQIEHLLKPYDFEDAFQGAAERAMRAIGSFDLPDHTDQLLAGIQESTAKALAAASIDYVDRFRDLATVESELVSERLRSLTEADVLSRALPDFRDTWQEPQVPAFDPTELVVETPFPDMLEALEEIREHQKASVEVMAAMHQSQTAHNQASLGVLQELHKAVVQTNARLDRQEEVNEHQRQGTAVLETLQIWIGTLMLIGVGVTIWLAAM